MATARSRKLIAAAKENANALQEQIATARCHLTASLNLLTRTTAMSLSPDIKTEATPRTFPAVIELIEQLERAAVEDADLAAGLTANIKRALRSETDAALLIAIMMEGIVQTVLNRVSVDEQRQLITALCGVLSDRFNEGGNRPN